MFRASLSIWPSNMGISKLTYTLKGEVLPKWLFDEYVSVSIRRHWRMWEKFSIISSLYHMRACSSNILIEYFLRHFYFLPPWRVSWVCESDFPQERQARDPTFYTWSSSGTCTEKMIKSNLLWYHWSKLFLTRN